MRRTLCRQRDAGEHLGGRRSSLLGREPTSVNVNPSMRHGFLAVSAFPRPPRLTLNRVLWSHMSPSRLMLGGGAEKGSGGGGRAQGGPISS